MLGLRRIGEAWLGWDGLMPIEYWLGWVGALCGLVKSAWDSTSEKRVRQRRCWPTKKVGEATISLPNVKHGLRHVEILVKVHEVVSWSEDGLLCLMDVKSLEFERGTSIVHFEFSFAHHLLKIGSWAFLPLSMFLIKPFIMVKKCID